MKDATPAQVGFKLQVRPDGSAVGKVGGGALGQRVRQEAVTALQEGVFHLLHYTLCKKAPKQWALCVAAR